MEQGGGMRFGTLDNQRALSSRLINSVDFFSFVPEKAGKRIEQVGKTIWVNMEENMYQLKSKTLPTKG